MPFSILCFSRQSQDQADSIKNALHSVPKTLGKLLILFANFAEVYFLINLKSTSTDI